MTAPDASDYEEEDLLDQLLREESAAVKTEPLFATKAEELTDAAASNDDAAEADDNDAATPEDAAAAAEATPAESKRRRRKRPLPTDENWVRTEREEQLMNVVFGNKDKLLEKLAEESHKARKQPDGADGALGGAAKRKAAWHDSDEETLEADDVIDYEHKGAPVVRKPGKYKAYLEHKFQTALGTPAWATLDRPVGADSDSDDELARTVGHLNTTKSQSALIKPNTLEVKRMKDLNRAGYAEIGGITGIQFHPTSSVALVTAGRSGIASIYSIDGRRNDKLHSITFEKFAIRACRLNRAGTEALIGGSKKYCYTFDLMSGTTQRVFLPKAVTQMSRFELSPCGRYVAVKGRFGSVHVLNAASKELLVTLKQENVCSAFAFTGDSQQLLVHSKDAEVTVFDMRRHRALHRFMDDGCINGSSLTLSPNGRLLACGSAQGVVNVYDYDAVLKSTMPRPLKTVFNLTTAITATQFNHTSELLALGSKEIDDAVKMVHCHSGTVYKNFPGMQGGIGRPQTMAFSPQSGYLAVGNANKEVALYRLKHFSNY